MQRWKLTKTLCISEDLKLPLDAVTATFCIVGIRGSGKSTTAVDMAEEMLKAKQQIVVLDPKDDWHGIRSSADGESEGFPVTIFGGKHQDAPLEYTGGALMAELILNEQISAIISTKHLSDGHRFRFAYDFCDHLYKHCEEPMHLFIDEADQFAPQEKNPRIQKGDTISEAMMLNLVRRVIKQGRTSGLGVSLITQSPATLDKRVMNMCETMIAMRIIGAQDFDAVERWFKVYLRKKDDLETIVSRLPTLKTGNGVFYSPAWLEVSKIVKFRMAETFDSRKTPKVGERRVEPKVLAPVDLKRLSERMAATIEKAKVSDPTFQRRTIADLQSQVLDLQTELERKPITPPAKEPIKMVTKTVEKLLIKDSQINRIEKLGAALGKRLDAVVEPVATLREFKLNLDGLLERMYQVNSNGSSPEPNESIYATTTTTNGDEYDMATFEEFRDRLITDSVFMGKILAHIRAGGTVRVEPKEVILKKFQQAEVDRLLERVGGLSVWQKQVLQLIEARGSGMSNSEILKAITGKMADQLGGSYKAKYAEIKDLVTLGLLRESGPRVFPNLDVQVKSQLQSFNATDQEIADVIGQVLLKLS